MMKTFKLAWHLWRASGSRKWGPAGNGCRRPSAWRCLLAATCYCIVEARSGEREAMSVVAAVL
jgi:hypothetical protein